ncbi:hypothetical protein R3W88_010517 [Solanum pinnatisectum]|uniref:Uncharacterized protein n=1 Tax=Solanum pinnatisectum TaxID=50273 RepID=A0AAV9MDU5_9SOLN|nr:hypothetical protein R3W88_010517 [Solanum pinnatisectum]
MITLKLSNNLSGNQSSNTEQSKEHHMIPLSIGSFNSQLQSYQITTNIEKKTSLTSFNSAYCKTMKSHSRILAAFVLALLLILSSESNATHAARFLSNKEHPSPKTTTLKGLHAKQKKPFKKVDSSFRRIPPSRWNPIQNKYKPP